ncbi:glycosyltransferase family 4 protein [Epilithonimonas vandammei]|uniref:glycosyltransferase family 4 protein n=1 Tax=Epilithonimonas vandammei TaxID=2487072 RepID=UPI0028AA7400|nr:glycosyltransferase family 4 protein [Epilithonimonas vandammei]
MRILHILNEFDNAGNGIVNVCCDLVCEQSRLNHDVLVVSSGGEYVTLIEKFGATHFYLDQSRTLINLPIMMIRFKEIVKEFNPDIIHAHMMTGTVIANLFKYFYKYKIITTVHNEYQKSAVLMKFADITVGVSDAVTQAMLNRGVSAEKAVTIKNGVLNSPRRKKIQDITPLQLKKPAIVTIGQLSKRKGSDILYEAFKNVYDVIPDVNLYYIGNPDWKELVEIVQSSDYKNNIHFVGLEKEPLKYLLSADLFVFPSLKEPFGLALIEAREAKLPIIASNVDGIPEALDGGTAGILVKPNHVNELSEKIITLLQDKSLAANYRQKAYHGIEKFTIKQMNDKYLDAYKSLL